MEALSAHSDHCRAAGYRIRGIRVLGEMDVARAKPKPSHEGRIPPAGSGCLLSGGQPEATSVPVDDVHQARRRST